ncbi:hypothetical protein P7D58_02410 [Enterococcus avium]|uniref:hypothetical protein n=1 Tax=Enterococcus avium TaxID=33945 RepID=UPI00288F44C4|nr:hypothetical protein [Enterococcus avium]MDT2392756.1 hypothetical protein [Enterococcus avium]MDT2416608.1 hypothetical protein [Enterococcus avium]MDT2429858.1 hypothetical protein [Enterococcus avium]MDT2438926.1 hypothetical protein [Enterococcus avium]MDT2451964.1 hypothetical protein [Enterococcus avium]
MFPIKRLTILNLVVNLIIVKITSIDVRAAVLCVVVIFIFEHYSDMIRRRMAGKLVKLKGDHDEGNCSSK